MPVDLLNLVDALETIARQAGAIALEQYGQTTVEEKGDRSVVTQADRDVEAFLRTRLARLLPEAAYVGEETARSAAANARAHEAEWLWAVDPIDGTASFTDGLDTFCVSIGLLHNGVPTVGAVYFPALRHLYKAAPEIGALYDGAPIHVKRKAPMPDRNVLFIDASTHHKTRRIMFPGKLRCMGSTALHFLFVARGAAVGALGFGYIWDYAGAAAVLLHAGGVIRHADGTEILWRDWVDGRRLAPPVIGAAPMFFEPVAQSIVFRD